MDAVKKVFTEIGSTRLIIGGFLVFLFIVIFALDMDSEMLIGDSLVRVGMHGILVLSLLLPIVAGIGINFAMPIGLLAGLVGGVLSLEYELQGWGGFFFAIALAIPLAILGGYLYSLLVNRVRGSEMMVGNFTALSIVALMSIVWMFIPLQNYALVWPMSGRGVRMTLVIEEYERILNNFLAFNITDRLVFPTGLFLAFFLLCFLVWLFMRTKTGISMQACGSNPEFARSIGIDINKMRTLSLIISACLGAIGIIVFSQSFGFYQFYTAPATMTIPTIASILIGGATIKKAKISHAIIGVILFQSILTISMPIANEVIDMGGLSDVVRVMVSNGIIVYALTKSGGNK